jgi:hypothetical protein
VTPKKQNAAPPRPSTVTDLPIQYDESFLGKQEESAQLIVLGNLIDKETYPFYRQVAVLVASSFTLPLHDAV